MCHATRCGQTQQKKTDEDRRHSMREDANDLQGAPHSTPLEMAVCGALLVAGGVVSIEPSVTEALKYVHERDFFDERCGRFVMCIKSQHERGLPWYPVGYLREVLRDTESELGDGDPRMDSTWFSDVLTNAGLATELPEYMMRLRRLRIRRALWLISEEANHQSRASDLGAAITEVVTMTGQLRSMWLEFQRVHGGKDNARTVTQPKQSQRPKHSDRRGHSDHDTRRVGSERPDRDRSPQVHEGDAGGDPAEEADLEPASFNV